jgi:cysteine synthase A
MIGIGQGRVTDNLAVIANNIDGAFTVSDEESISMVYELLDTEGLYLGASSALNVAAAAQLAQRLGKGSRILARTIDHFIILFIIHRFEGRHYLM